MRTLAIRKALGAVVLLGGVAFAADQLVPTKILLVKDKPGDATKRKINFKVKENASAATVVGDPIASGGATLHVVLTGGGDQCFSMPASGWSNISDLGFKYKDPDLTNGAVKVASIKKTPSGVFQIKVTLKGSGSEAITIVPGNPTATYGTNFALGGGDSYCAGTGTTPATPNPNDEKTFKVVNDTPPASCTASACASPSGAFVDR
jgi:hypothetical protein